MSVFQIQCVPETEMFMRLIEMDNSKDKNVLSVKEGDADFITSKLLAHLEELRKPGVLTMLEFIEPDGSLQMTNRVGVKSTVIELYAMAVKQTVFLDTGVEYFALAPFAWGRGPTMERAIANCKTNIPWNYIKKDETGVPIHIFMFTDGLEININDVTGALSWNSEKGTMVKIEVGQARRPRRG